MSAYLNALMEEGTREDLLREVVRLYDECATLRVELARKDAALRPFAALHDEILECCAQYVEPHNDPEGWAKSCDWVDLTNAKSALSPTPAKPVETAEQRIKRRAQAASAAFYEDTKDGDPWNRMGPEYHADWYRVARAIEESDAQVAASSPGN